MYANYLQFVRVVLEASSREGASGRAEAVERIARWITDVAEWNRRVDLTAARNERELVDLLVADAASLASRIDSGASLVDVGTGAGAPGLALAALRPDLRVTLVEPLQKRAALLRITVGKWRERSGGGIEVVQQHGDELVAAARTFDLALSRATLPPPKWLALGAHLAPMGDVWVLLAREPDPVLAGWQVVEAIDYAWPLTGARRRAVRYRATAA
jgi:16S rRNA (guanine527-N7)-methyltransferase